jgi:hypothetical protein
MIAILGTDTTHTITFGTPVVNPVMDIVSLGQAGIDTQYDFSLSSGQSMSILEQGPSYGFWGCDTCLSLSGTTLTGTEGDGVIQFIGTFTSLTWTGANPENWNGFTFGVPVVDPPNATPEPATWASTLLVALIAAPFALRRLTVRAQ